MADPNFPRGDTSPPLRGTAADDAGLIDLTTAVAVTLYAKGPTRIITGTVEVLDPPERDAADPTVEYNWRYLWQPGDTDAPGEYRGQLELDKGAGAIETVPNGRDGTPAYFTFHVVVRVASAADVGP